MTDKQTAATSLWMVRVIWFSAGASIYGLINLLVTRSPEQAAANAQAWWRLLHGG